MKPTVFNYQEYERVVEENKKLNAEVADLRIRCRIADGDKRDCKSCKHQKADGCSRWNCEYEPKADDIISRADAIDTVEELNRKVNDGRENDTICTSDVLRRINALPSADTVATFRTGQTYGKSTSIRELVEVVRCKDCKHRYEEAECPMYWEEQIDIDEGDGYYDTDYIIHDYTQDNGYCHYGERRKP